MEIITKPYFDKNLQVALTKQIPSRQSFSPTIQLTKTEYNALGHSSSTHISEVQNVNLAAVLVILNQILIWPIFKEAKYSQTSVIDFLREVFFSRHLHINYNIKLNFKSKTTILKLNSVITQIQLRILQKLFTSDLKNPLTQKLLNPPKWPPLSSDKIKTLIFELDETLILQII
ncbi:unnamed protein product (macronuclear) [Paramecium tetraurelia]|uniref:Uncharacterized protein n=1 Tax=Paramecium tetraurelia TaxID=5888 RepID=A0EB38_PARTE|nr:uncharacterized protein GSPATT00025239001 [Paramecium tetraurelia]CAK92505.1 unnamed protein product [Paramecium tetraurelia]|eukprot:XP_001459902.1 hypothetical protein (macronuclear) [Paramecium tetraurelia strain d4-2]